MKLLIDELVHHAGKSHHHKDKKNHKILKKMAKLEKKLSKYNLEANQSDSSGSSSSSDEECRRKSRRGTRSRGKSHGHHKRGKRSSSNSSDSSSSSSSSSSRSPSPPAPRHHRHPHHSHHHGPSHLMGRSRSFGGRSSGPALPWGRHHRGHPLEHPHGLPHHRGLHLGRHHRHHEKGMPGWFGFVSHRREEVTPTNGCCDEAQPELVDLSANGEEDQVAAASNVEDMEEDVNGQESPEEEEEEPERGPEINEELAKNWTEIIEKGLPDDRRTALMRKYPVSINCLPLLAPKINKEVLAVAPELAVERDSLRMQEQTQIAAGLAALGQAMSDLESKIAKDKDLSAVYDTLNEAADVIVDAHHNMTQTRQALVASELHRRFRPHVENCKPDSLLFGKDFGEKVKDVKGFRKACKAQRPKSQYKKGGKSRGEEEKRKSKRVDGKGCETCRRGPEQQ